MKKINYLSINNALENNLKLTGNRFPDVEANGIPYDFKILQRMSISKNHIYMMPASTAATELFLSYFSNLLEQCNRADTPYNTLLTNKIKILSQELKANPTPVVAQAISIKWNDFLINTIEQRPPQMGIPLFIITNHSYQQDPACINDIQKIPLREGTLDQVKVKEAMYAIVGNYPDKLKHTIYIATKGSLGQHVVTTETVD